MSTKMTKAEDLRDNRNTIMPDLDKPFGNPTKVGHGIWLNFREENTVGIEGPNHIRTRTVLAVLSDEDALALGQHLVEMLGENK